jgi:hypothetical protein
MKPRQHEHMSGNRMSQLLREGDFSCACVVAVFLCRPPWAQGVIYQFGISRPTGYSSVCKATD